MSMWSLRWHFTNKSITGAPCSIKGYSYSLPNSRTLWWRVRWLKQCRLEVTAELQQWWDGAERTDDGRAFHARAAVTDKARSPSMVHRVDGMTSIDLEALRRCRHEPTSAVEWRVSARYDGAVPIRPRYARTHNRNWILSGTFSQCSSQAALVWACAAKRWLGEEMHGVWSWGFKTKGKTKEDLERGCSRIMPWTVANGERW